MNRRSLLLGGTALVMAGGGWALLQSGRGTGPDTGPLPGIANPQERGDALPLAEMTMGAEDAPVEMIEYASFTCPHCATFHEEVWPRLKADYIDTGKVRFIYREVYFDRPGLWASMIARCGGEARFFGITEILYERQGEWAAGGDPAVIAANLERIGKSAGLSDEDISACLSDGEMAEALVGWFRTNAEADDITGTPSFVIDGEKVSNRSYDDLRALLDAKLEG